MVSHFIAHSSNESSDTDEILSPLMAVSRGGDLRVRACVQSFCGFLDVDNARVMTVISRIYTLYVTIIVFSLVRDVRFICHIKLCFVCLRAYLI